MNLFSGLMSMMRGSDFKEETPNKHKNNNNLQQAVYSDTSSVQNDLSGRQREMIDLSENRDVDPHTLGNPHFDSFTDMFGPATQNPDGTWSHRGNLGDMSENNNAEAEDSGRSKTSVDDALVNEIQTGNAMFDNLTNDYGLTNDMQNTMDYEGVSDSIYTDTKGHLTYGAGHKLTPAEIEEYGLGGQSYAPNQVFHDKKVAKDKITGQFTKDYEHAQEYAKRAIGEGFDDMPEEMRAIVTDMTFNLGQEGIKKFPGFLQALRNKDYKRAAAELRYVNPQLNESGEYVAGDRGESGYWSDVGAGDSRYTSGEWDTAGNRGWDHYNTLMSYKD